MAERNGDKASAETRIVGREKVISVFGRWPTFHDAEVLWLGLDRHGPGVGTGPSLEAVIHAFEMTSEVAPTGHYVLKNHVLVHLRFVSVERVCLDGFNHQNALYSLSIRDAEPGAGESPDDRRFEVTLDPAYGLGGTFACGGVEVVEVRPCDAGGEPLGSDGN